MHFTLRTSVDAPDLTAIERELSMIDPAAMLDLAASGQAMRIWTLATGDELLECLRQSGLAAEAGDLVQLPSECCGGCGG